MKVLSALLRCQAECFLISKLMKKTPPHILVSYRDLACCHGQKPRFFQNLKTVIASRYGEYNDKSVSWKTMEVLKQFHEKWPNLINK